MTGTRAVVRVGPDGRFAHAGQRLRVERLPNTHVTRRLNSKDDHSAPCTRPQEENSPAFSSIVRSRGMSFFARAQNALRRVQHYVRPFPICENALDYNWPLPVERGSFNGCGAFS